MPPKSANSVHQFIKVLTELLEREWYGACGDAHLWFRGQSDAKWGLIPQVYRSENETVFENDIRSEFERRAPQFLLEHRPDNHWKWYFLMQHYGAPTRLLDWTDGALLGLYFAVRFHPRDQDAAVWVLDPQWLNSRSIKFPMVALPEDPKAEAFLPNPIGAKLKVKSPIAIDPPHIARRITVQRSHFTLHGTIPDGIERLAKMDKNPRVLKVVIPARAIALIQNQLFLVGISETTVFPDLVGLCKELKLDWTRRNVIPPSKDRADSQKKRRAAQTRI